MSVQQYTDPVILDSTGLSIVQKLDQIKDAVQPTNPCLDIDITIPASGWSSTAPYIYTYSNAHITTGCAVEVNYLESENADTVLYLEYEKVNGGVRFEAPTKPSAGIPVRIHIMNADATSVLSITADEVSTDAVSGTSNVEDALSSLSDHIGKIRLVFANSVSFSSGQGSVSVTGVKVGSRIIASRNQKTATSLLFTAYCETDGTVSLGAYDTSGSGGNFTGTISNLVLAIDDR